MALNVNTLTVASRDVNQTNENLIATSVDPNGKSRNKSSHLNLQG